MGDKDLWGKRIRNGITWLIDITLVAIGVFGLVLVVLGHYEVWQPIAVAGPFQEIVIASLSLLLLALGLERLLDLKPIHAAVSLEPRTKLAQKLEKLEETVAHENSNRELGIRVFYPDREQLPTIPEYFGLAKSDILICALSADALITTHGDVLENKLREGCGIRFLLLDDTLANDKVFNHLAPPRHASRTTSHLIDALVFLDDLWTLARSENFPGKLQVRKLDFVPSMGIIMLDGHENLGRIRIEQYIYKCRVSDRPSYEIVSSSSALGLFPLFRKQIELCWKDFEHTSLFTNEVGN